jgi:hypothetical protein
MTDFTLGLIIGILTGILAVLLSGSVTHPKS